MQKENQEADAKSIYHDIDRRSRDVPDSILTYDGIAKYLTLNTTDDHEKVRALHIWITHNIDYDLHLSDSSITYNSSVFEKLLIQDVLSNKKGVCMHYAMLFHKMCEALDIPSYYISGYTRESGSTKIANESHAWNAVKLDSSFYFMDNTWAAGYVQNGNYVNKFRDKYFLIAPKDFIKTHIPFDPIWQFLDNPISHNDFMKKDYGKLNTTGEFNFMDSISAIKNLSSVSVLTKEKERITEAGIVNDLIQIELESIEHNIWVENYNASITVLKLARREINLAITESNKFVKFLNKKTPNKEGEEAEMKLVVKKMVRHFRKGVSSLNKAKTLVQSLSSPRKKQFQTKSLAVSMSIGSLENEIARIKPSIKLYAVYADITIQ